MKKTFLSLAVACMAIVASNQTFAQTKTRIGITAGLNYTTLGSGTSGGTTINYDYRPGFQGGIYAEVPIAQSVTFAPHLLFSQKGGNINTTISGITFKGSTQISYLDVPLLFDFKMKSGFSFFAGPQVSFLSSQNSTITGTMGTVTATQSSTDTQGFRKTIFGGNLGLAYQVNTNIGLKIHYILDFQHAADDSNDTGEKNSGFALTLGYSF